MSLAGLKLNPAIAKETSNGQILCIVCAMQVKSKLWTAHVNGKKHREAVDRTKKQLRSAPPAAVQPAAPRREAPPPSDAPPAKKSKGDVPSDFFDGEAPLGVTTPWQRDKEEKEVVKEAKGTTTIEDLPQGFFDDKKKNARVRETIEKEKQMEAEYDRMTRELAEEKEKAELLREKEEDAECRQREIDQVDEHMRNLQELIELEKRKDAIVEGRRHREDKELRKKQEDDDDDGEDDVEMSFGWRDLSFK